MNEKNISQNSRIGFYFFTHRDVDCCSSAVCVPDTFWCWKIEYRNPYNIDRFDALEWPATVAVASAVVAVAESVNETNEIFFLF